MLNENIDINTVIKSFYDLSEYIENPIVKYRYTNLIKKYSKILSSLEFNYNISFFNIEHYEYTYTFDTIPTMDDVKVYWNVEKLVNFVLLNNLKPIALNINNFCENVYINETVDIDNNFIPKDSNIIIASLITPQYNYILVDGNHRINFYRKNNINEVETIILPFLVHRKFIVDDSTRILVSIINNVNVFMSYYVNKTIDKDFFSKNFINIPIFPFSKDNKQFFI